MHVAGIAADFFPPGIAAVAKFLYIAAAFVKS